MGTRPSLISFKPQFEVHRECLQTRALPKETDLVGGGGGVVVGRVQPVCAPRLCAAYTVLCFERLNRNHVDVTLKSIMCSRPNLKMLMVGGGNGMMMVDGRNGVLMVESSVPPIDSHYVVKLFWSPVKKKKKRKKWLLVDGSKCCHAMKVEYVYFCCS